MTSAAKPVEPTKPARKTKKAPEVAAETVPKKGRGRGAPVEQAPATPKPTKAVKAESKKAVAASKLTEKPAKKPAKTAAKAEEAQQAKATPKSPAKSKTAATAEKKQKSETVSLPRTGSFKLSRTFDVPVPLDVPRGPQRKKLNISVGDTIHGFKIVEVRTEQCLGPFESPCFRKC